MVVAKSRARVHACSSAPSGAHGRQDATTRWCRATPTRARGTVDAPIDRHPTHDYKWAVVAGGQAERHPLRDARGVPRRPACSRSSWRPGAPTRSGCTCRALRHPCVGDLTYGADPMLAERLGPDPAVAARRPAGLRPPGRRPPGRVHLAPTPRTSRRRCERVRSADRRRRPGVPLGRAVGRVLSGRVVAVLLSTAVTAVVRHGRSQARPTGRAAPSMAFVGRLVRAPARAHRVLDARRRGPARRPVRRGRPAGHAGAGDDRPRQRLRRLRLLQAGQGAGVKPIIGMEGYYVPVGTRFDRQPFDLGGAGPSGGEDDVGLAGGKRRTPT